jgi:hypothetical protein
MKLRNRIDLATPYLVVAAVLFGIAYVPLWLVGVPKFWAALVAGVGSVALSTAFAWCVFTVGAILADCFLVFIRGCVH